MLFDSHAFLTERFGSPKNVLVLFTAYGVDAPSAAAVEKWFQRRSVPSEYLPIMACIVELESGEPVRFAQYLRQGGVE